MRFLAGESCDFAVVRALRAEGHDVLAVGEFQQRSVDQDVMELAVAEDRILLTEDKDFGRLAFAARADSPGVILIRFPAPARGYDPAVGDGMIACQYRTFPTSCFFLTPDPPHACARTPSAHAPTQKSMTAHVTTRKMG